MPLPILVKFGSVCQVVNLCQPVYFWSVPVCMRRISFCEMFVPLLLLLTIGCNLTFPNMKGHHLQVNKRSLQMLTADQTRIFCSGQLGAFTDCSTAHSWQYYLELELSLSQKQVKRKETPMLLHLRYFENGAKEKIPQAMPFIIVLPFLLSKTQQECSKKSQCHQVG